MRTARTMRFNKNKKDWSKLPPFCVFFLWATIGTEILHIRFEKIFGVKSWNSRCVFLGKLVLQKFLACKTIACDHFRGCNIAARWIADLLAEFVDFWVSSKARSTPTSAFLGISHGELSLRAMIFVSTATVQLMTQVSLHGSCIGTDMFTMSRKQQLAIKILRRPSTVAHNIGGFACGSGQCFKAMCRGWCWCSHSVQEIFWWSWNSSQDAAFNHTLMGARAARWNYWVPSLNSTEIVKYHA